MKSIFVVALVCLTNIAHSANYYFSSLSGSDSRTAAQAQNPSAPWKTLNQLNSFFSSLKPGDSVLLKRGETFYGSIIVKQHGSVVLPIVIGAYGSGKKPVITSLVAINDWVFKGNGIWQSSHPYLGAAVNMVLLNGAQQGMGRYPNKDAANNGYLNFESHVGKTSITDNQLSSAVNWTGAELVLRPRHWILERNTITAHSGTKISYGPSSSPYDPYDDYGYFIQNSLKTLDKFGEWHYNAAQKTLSVYFGSSTPSSYVLQASSMDDLISSVKYSNILFDNLVIKGANGSGFSIVDGSNISVQNCDILFSGKNGVFMSNHSNFQVKNCTISNQHNNGIDIETGDYAIVRNNKIINTYLIAGMGINGEGMGIGINISSNNSITENNDIRNTGYQGIHFNGSDVSIKNNLIDSFCMVKDDGGGIYSNKAKEVFKRRKVSGNVILNGIGTGEGTDNAGKVAAHGVYMDNNASEAEFVNNTIANCAVSGFYIHNSFGMTIKDNLVFNNKIQLNMIQDADNVPIRDCIVTGNVLFSKLRDQWVLSLKSSGNDIKSFGRFDSNYYARPIDEAIIIYNSYVTSNGSWVDQSLDLEGWKKAYGQDMHSKKTAKQIAPFTIVGLVGANKFYNGGNFTSDVKGVAVNACAVSHGNSGMLDNGYLQVTPSAPTSSFYVKVGSLTKGKKYMLSYSLKGSTQQNMIIDSYIRQTESPYATLTPAFTRKVAVSRTENEMLFSPSTTETAASVVFEVDNQSRYYVDNVKFYEANAKITNPNDSIRFYYNATATGSSVSLNGTYIDTKGKMYFSQINLPPYTSAILIKTSGTADDVINNIAPTAVITAPVSNAVFSPLSDVTVSAAVADVDGSITKVEFYNGTTLLKTEFKPSYDCTLGSIAIGNYSITVKAYDNKGMATTSSPVVFSVPSLNLAPVVSITTPAKGSVYSSPATIKIAATATDADGSITKVEFFNGTTLLATEIRPPYTYTWQNLPEGNYTIKAKATDDKGMYRTSAIITLSVKAQQASRGASSAALENDADSLTNLSNGNLTNAAVTGVSPLVNEGKLLRQSDLSALYNFRLAPNPAINAIRLYFDAVQNNNKANIIIQNAAGAIVKKYPVVVSGKNIEVDISGLISGIYILSLSGDNFSISKKFLKAN